MLAHSHPLRQERFFIVLVIIIAAILRCYKVGDIFIGGDEPDRVLYALQLFRGSFLSFDPLYNPIGRLMLYAYNPAHMVIFALVISTFSAMSMPLTELAFIMPNLLEGLLSLVLLYVLVKRMFNKNAAAIAMVILALHPLHIALSRSTPEWMINLDFLLITLIVFIRYFEKPVTWRAWRAGCMLGLFLVSDWRAYLLLGLIPLVGISEYQDQHGGGLRCFRLSVKPTLRRLLRKEIIIPPLVIMGLYGIMHLGLVMSGHPEKGFFGRLLLKDIAVYPQWGFHITEFFRTLVTINGYGLVICLPIAVVFALFQWRREPFLIFMLGWLGLFSVVFMVVLSPVTFAVTSEMWCVSVAMIIVVSFMVERLIDHCKHTRSVGVIMLGLIMVTMLIVTAQLVYRFPVRGQDVPPMFGSMRANTGIKTAGWYVRQNTSPEARIYCELEQANAMYYLNRISSAWNYKECSLALLMRGQTDEEVYEYCRAHYYHAAEVRVEGAPSIDIFSPYKSDYQVMEAAVYDPVFDETYGTVFGLVDAPFMTSQIAQNRVRFGDMTPAYQNRITAVKEDCVH